MKPLFIFSLPKSGSTLLQRMLAASGRISTTTETWLLLPLLYTMKPDGAVSEYWHGHAVAAIEDFFRQLPNGKADFQEALRVFAIDLYRKRTAEESLYFLDKTPRYHLICEEIIELFPDGKFIFLWRNPLAVASSIIRRWNHDKWKICLYNIDLYRGMDRLVAAAEGNRAGIHCLRYEDLIENPALELEKICSYLGLEYNERMIDSFYDTRLEGRMTEHTGSRHYGNRIGRASLETWKQTFTNPFRRRWAARYLDWIGPDRLGAMGYDHADLKALLKANGTLSLPQLLSDLAISLSARTRTAISPLQVHRSGPPMNHYL